MEGTPNKPSYQSLKSCGIDDTLRGNKIHHGYHSSPAPQDIECAKGAAPAGGYPSLPKLSIPGGP